MIKKIFILILITFFGSFIALSASEIILRIKNFNNKTTILWQGDKFVGQRLKPSQTGLFVSPTGEYKMNITVNNQGWRDVEHTTDKPSNVYRILFLGDSFVENFQVPLDETFYRQIQKNIPETNGKKVEIITTGLGNTGTAQQLLILENYSLIYHPDLVIQMFLTANDVANNSPVLQNDPYMPYFKLSNNQLVEIPFISRERRPLSKIKSFMKKSYLAQLLLDYRQKIIEGNDATKYNYPIEYHIYDDIYSQDYKDAWEATYALISKTKSDVEQSGGKYILVTLANNEQVNSDVQKELSNTYPKMDFNKMDFLKPDKLLSDFCKTQNITCWQMLPFFLDYVSSHPGSVTHYHYDGHWNQLGTNLAAEFLNIKIRDYLRN